MKLFCFFLGVFIVGFKSATVVFALIAHFSPQNLLTLHAYYQIGAKQRNRSFRAWRNRSPSRVSAWNVVHKSLATGLGVLVVWIVSFQGCQANWLIHENSETERQGEPGFMQPSLISQESGSRLSHREA